MSGLLKHYEMSSNVEVNWTQVCFNWTQARFATGFRHVELACLEARTPAWFSQVFLNKITRFFNIFYISD